MATQPTTQGTKADTQRTVLASRIVSPEVMEEAARRDEAHFRQAVAQADRVTDQEIDRSFRRV